MSISQKILKWAESVVKSTLSQHEEILDDDLYQEALAQSDDPVHLAYQRGKVKGVLFAISELIKAVELMIKEGENGTAD